MYFLYICLLFTYILIFTYSRLDGDLQEKNVSDIENDREFLVNRSLYIV